MKIGIFFGGPSREREVSFAGGRTVYDNLNKALFEPVPIFVDSLGNFVLLDWQYVYKGTIRDFYPPVSELPDSPNGFQVYIESLGQLSDDQLDRLIGRVGKRVFPHQFRYLFDFAFLCLHGPYGEDGSIQGLLEWHQIPYSGSGILPSAIGINKMIQSTLARSLQFPKPDNFILTKDAWFTGDKSLFFNEVKEKVGLPLVVKAPQQGSSIGVTVLMENNFDRFVWAVNRGLFVEEVTAAQWQGYAHAQKVKFIEELVDIRSGIGMPVYYSLKTSIFDTHIVYHPEELLSQLDAHFAQSGEVVVLTSEDSEEAVLFEGFIKGQEFSCIIIQDENGEPLALPPTEIVKFDEFFDYRSKYLPGMSRKVTPVNTTPDNIRKIQDRCCDMFRKLKFNVYARIDGFLAPDGEVFLNDPNTTSGMLPSSFFFHQAAEVGMNPSQFITYILRTSLAERVKTGKDGHRLKRMLRELDEQILSLHQEQRTKTRVGVIMGGYSSERHISIESGRNIYEKLASSDQYEAVPIFLTGGTGAHELYITPIHILLKDNADDIREKIHKALTTERFITIQENFEAAKNITQKYVGAVNFIPERVTYSQLADRIDAAFIALHGRPGEDGEVQQELLKVGIPFNGSGPESSRVTIDKYETNERLAKHGILVANHALVQKADWQADMDIFYQKIERQFAYPFIAKPHDDGCSSAVKKLKNRADLEAYCHLAFREADELPKQWREALHLQKNEEFPRKTVFLVEDLITANGAERFLEVTGGMLTHWADGQRRYETFEPSEALATGDVLSLEEKFLAGQGQNITPARYSKDPEQNRRLSLKVQETLHKTAEILGVEGYCRIDAFVRIFPDERVETIIIEVNSLPGMTPATCIFHQSAINGYKPYDFMDRILQYGMGRK